MIFRGEPCPPQVRPERVSDPLRAADLQANALERAAWELRQTAASARVAVAEADLRSARALASDAAFTARTAGERAIREADAIAAGARFVGWSDPPPKFN